MNERSSVHGEDDRTCRPSLYAKWVLPAQAIESFEPGRGDISPYWRRTKDMCWYRAFDTADAPAIMKSTTASAMSAIDVHLVKRTAASGGVGEPGTSAVMPAVANAIFAGDGQARPQAAGEGPTAFDLDDAAASDMLDRRVA
jgi:hypothetical protein